MSPRTAAATTFHMLWSETEPQSDTFTAELDVQSGGPGAPVQGQGTLESVSPL